MNFTVLSVPMQPFAISANTVIKNHYGLGNGAIETSMHKDIPLRPTLHWKTRTHYIACEVHNELLPISISIQFTEIIASGKPIRIMVAIPENTIMKAEKFNRDLDKARKLGIGILIVNENGGRIEYLGVSLPLRIEPITISSYPPRVRPIINNCYHTYMKNGDPKGALRDLGEAIEGIIRKIAEQSNNRGRLSNNFDLTSSTSQYSIINELIDKRIIDRAILGSCQEFREERNRVSHPPQTQKAAFEIEEDLKTNFLLGIRILKRLPAKIRDAGYRLQIS